MPQATVVIPVRNDPARLAKLLRSFEPEDFNRCEVLLIDDASTDDTAEIAGQFPLRVINVGARSIGPAAARNLGAREATSEILIFLDSDIVLGPGALGKMTRWFTDPAVNGVSTVASIVPENDGFIPRYAAQFERFAYFNLVPGEQADPPDGPVTGWWYFSTRCGAIRKSVFDQVGGFDASFKRPSVEDTEFGFRLSENFRMMMDPAVELTHNWARTLPTLLKRVFRNARLVMGLTLKRGKPPASVVPQSEAARRGVSALATLLLLPAPLCGYASMLAAAVIALSCLLYAPLFRAFFRDGGLLFLLGCVGVHHLVSLAGVSGAASALFGVPLTKEPLHG